MKRFHFQGKVIHYKSKTKVKNNYSFEDSKPFIIEGILHFGIVQFPVLQFYSFECRHKFLNDFPFVTINGIEYKTKSAPYHLVALEIV